MAHYFLHLTFDWKSVPIKDTEYYPLVPQLYYDDNKTPVPKEQGVKTRRFLIGDTATLQVFRKDDKDIPTDEQATPTSVAFLFTHANDCPEQPSGAAGDSPFAGHNASDSNWPLVLKGDFWGVEGYDPKVTMESHLSASEDWHFAINLYASGLEDTKLVPRTFRFDPELVVDPW